MAKCKTPQFFFDAESGRTTCILTDGKHEFIGEAYCCDEDRDMMSEKTGCAISLMRAEIEYYIHMRDNEILPVLAALKHLYACISHGSNFNALSHENVLLRRQIHQKESDLTVVRQLLTEKKQELKTIIAEKDKFYKRIRANRAAKEDSVGQN